MNEPRTSFTVFAFVLGIRLGKEILLSFLVLEDFSDALPPSLLPWYLAGLLPSYSSVIPQSLFLVIYLVLNIFFVASPAVLPQDVLRIRHL
jgi:hypothetical protein